MKYKSLFLSVFLISVFFQINLSASEQAGQRKYLQPGPYNVGFKHFTVPDETRTSVVIDVVSGSITKKYVPREIKIYLWYPANIDETTKSEPMDLNSYFKCMEKDFARSSENVGPKVMMNFPIAKNEDHNYLRIILGSPFLAHKDVKPAEGRYPVVIFGQGYHYESPVTHFYLCEYLASRGYIIATSPLTGQHTPAVNLTPEDLETQVRDMEFVASVAMRLPFAEQGKLAVAGFDLGGLSAAMFTMRNPIVRAVVSLDAGLIFKHNLDLMSRTTGFNPARITASILHFIRPAVETEAMGIKEDFSLWEAASSEKMFLVRIPGMQHADFTSYGLFEAKLPVRGYWGASTYGTVEKYWAVCWAVGDFLDAALKNDRKKAVFGEEQIKDIFKNIPITVESRSNEPQQLTLDDFLNLVYSDRSEDAYNLAKEIWKSNPNAEFLQEPFLNNLGYRLLYFSGTPAAALDIFNLNVQIHPASSNAYDSLGEAYLSVGQLDLAIENYKKSLELNQKNDNARKMLERIEKNK